MSASWGKSEERDRSFGRGWGMKGRGFSGVMGDEEKEKIYFYPTHTTLFGLGKEKRGEDGRGSLNHRLSTGRVG
jgi:hypothetical protein